MVERRWLLVVVAVLVVLVGWQASGQAEESIVGTALPCGWGGSLSQAGAYPGADEAGDMVGSAVVTGDFNGDGQLDVVAGAPGENNGSGAVNVFYAPCGSGTDRLFTQNSSGVRGSSERGDGFGAALASGDVNGDGFDDLIVGLPTEDIGTKVDAGGIVVLFGTGNGLTGSGSLFFTQAAGGGGVEAGDLFGSALGVGDFDGDGFDDVLIGAYGEAYGSRSGAGAVTMLPGSSNGPTSAGAWIMFQAGPLKGSSEAGDHLGYAIAVGDFNNDGFDDAAFSAPGEGIGTRTEVGAVHVLDGSSNGLTTSGQQFVHQNTTGVPGANENGDQFASTLAAGDVNGDGRDDLVAGAPYEDISTKTDAGSFVLFLGNSTGIDLAGTFQSASSPGIKGAAEPGDNFGAALAVVDLNGDGRGEVVTGIPGEDTSGRTDTGAIQIIIANASGLSTGDYFITQNSAGIPGSNENGDRFGYTLAAGDAAVFVGTPHEAISVRTDAGVVVPVALPAPPISTYGPGTYLVGSQIPAGRYEANAQAGCYWERLSGLSGDSSDIISNDFRSFAGPVVVDILASDVAFSFDPECGTLSDYRAPATPATSIGAGSHVVGSDIAAGLYESAAEFGCYWERTTAFSGDIDDVIANDFRSFAGPLVVQIEPGDEGFYVTDDCGTLTPYTAPSSPATSFGPGTHVVGSDIAPGTYSTTAASGCYWERLSGFNGTLGDIIANDFISSPGPAIVAIQPTDPGFYATDECGTWSQ